MWLGGELDETVVGSAPACRASRDNPGRAGRRRQADLEQLVPVSAEVMGTGVGLTTVSSNSLADRRHTFVGIG